MKEEHADAINPVEGETIREKYGPIGAAVIVIIAAIAHYMGYAPSQPVLNALGLLLLAAGGYLYREFLDDFL